jgi:hypothetical protein
VSSRIGVRSVAFVNCIGRRRLRINLEHRRPEVMQKTTAEPPNAEIAKQLAPAGKDCKAALAALLDCTGAALAAGNRQGWHAAC